MQPIDQIRTDVQLTLLAAQLARRGLGSLIPHIVAGARWRVERGRLWVYLDADGAGQQKTRHP
jgi:hypothetical protein